MGREAVTAFQSETFGQDASFRLEQPIGSMSISPCGRDVVLASREGLHVIDLDSPWDPPRYLPHHTSWEVADVQWSPHAAKDHWVASTSNQKALVWNLEAPSNDAIELILHGHTRAITDINFSAHDPNVLATCAVDSFVHCWDLRTHPLRPATSFSDWFAGATQVKWSRQDPHVIASAHDRYLRIWDDRKGAFPVRSIEAHATKIYGVDWNRFEANKIVTCSLDRTVKFWNCDNLEDVPERVIETPFPVWRARHTPFGWGLLAMPQRGNGDLYLYDRQPHGGSLVSGAAAPVTIFSGHKGQVKEFLWRVRGNIEEEVDHRDFQLVSWGTDRELRLHRIDEETNVGIGYEKGVSKTRRLNFTRKGAKYRTFRNEPGQAESPSSELSKVDSPSLPGQLFRYRPRTFTNVGMNKVAISRFRGWVQGSSSNNTRIGMHGKSNFQQDMNPIAWMKNVKISSWDQDPLAEEITQVGEQFSNVNFESVDIQSRRATISMNGPWGEQHASLYIRIDMRFPKLYPREVNAIFTIQKTGSMTPALLKTLSADMQTITDAYATRRKGCLEAILQYLLRDRTKDQLLSLIMDQSINDSRILQGSDLAGEYSSSDDDDDRIPNFSGNVGLRDSSNILDANALTPLAKGCGALWTDKGMLVCFFPPKATEPASFLEGLNVKDQEDLRSGKVFGGFGHLPTDSINSRSIGGPKTTEDGEESTASDESSSSASGSSPSSDAMSAMPSGFLPKRAWHMSASGLQRSRSADPSNHSTNGIGQTGSGMIGPVNVVSIRPYEDLIPSKKALALEYKVFGTGQEVCEHNALVAERAGDEAIASVWRLAKLILHNDVPLESVRDLRSGQDIVVVARAAASGLKRKDSDVDLSRDLEVKSRKLATTGRVRWGNSPFGPSYLVSCLFKYFQVIGDVQMLAMLSCIFAEPRASDPETLLQPHKDHDLSMQLKAPAFSIDYFPSINVAMSVINKSMEANFSMPNLRPDLISEKAISSSVIEQNRSDARQAGTGVDAVSRFRAGAPHLDLRHLSRLSSLAGSDVADSGPSSPHSASVSTSVSLSTSPENSRMSERSNSNFAIPFSRSSLSNLSQSYSSSPPANSGGGGAASGLKKYSPSGSLAVGGWSTSGLFGSSISAKSARFSQQSSGPSSEDTKASPSLASAAFSGSKGGRGSRTPENSRGSMASTTRASVNTTRTRSSAINFKRKVRLKVSLHNQTEFDKDGYASVPLLKPELEWKYRSFRASYAHLLGAWQLYPQMAEVLKFDGLTSYFADPEVMRNNNDDGHQDDEISIGNARRRKTIIEASRAEAAAKKGLEVRKCCRDCGKSLAVIEKNGIPFGWHCATTSCPAMLRKMSTRAFCTICDRVINGLMVPCLNCGHVTCDVCAEEWFGSEWSKSEVYDEDNWDDTGPDIMPQACPSGCGCQCSMHEFVSVPDPAAPQNEVAATPAALARPKSQASTTRSERLMSSHGPDAALQSFLSLTRSRSISTAKESLLKGRSSVDEPAAIGGDEGASKSDEDLDPWPRSKNSGGLGRGFGHGSSKGLSTKSSDATIRKSVGR